MKTPKELALLAAKALSDKKGKEIRVLEIAELTTLADYFVLATGSSNTQINALERDPDVRFIRLSPAGRPALRAPAPPASGAPNAGRSGRTGGSIDGPRRRGR